MKLTAKLLCFSFDKSESLAPLVKECGFERTSPTRAVKQYTNYSAEVDRVPGEAQDKVFIKLSGKSEELTLSGGYELLLDLAQCGLIDKHFT